MKVQADRLKEIAIQVLKGLHAAEDEAAVVADALIQAELRGIDTHGVHLLTLPWQDKQGRGPINSRFQPCEWLSSQFVKHENPIVTGAVNDLQSYILSEFTPLQRLYWFPVCKTRSASNTALRNGGVLDSRDGMPSRILMINEALRGLGYAGVQTTTVPVFFPHISFT